MLKIDGECWVLSSGKAELETLLEAQTLYLCNKYRLVKNVCEDLARETETFPEIICGNPTWPHLTLGVLSAEKAEAVCVNRSGRCPP